MNRLTLVILAAGMGSRYGGLKQLQRLAPHGKTLIDYSLNDARFLGFTHVVFVIREEMETEFQREISRAWGRDFEISHVYQRQDDIPYRIDLPKREKPWGTGHAVWSAKGQISAPFGVINADDYYGRSSLKMLADFLRGVRSEENRHALVSFSLGHTFSPYGAVSRGVCNVNGKTLVNVEEYQAICRKDLQIYGNGRPQPHLRDDTPVSMNMWGFTPTIFAWMERKFVDFFKSAGDLRKDEYLLPAVVNAGIEEGEYTVSVFHSPDTWLGITHKEDLEWVQQRVAQIEI